MENEYTVNYGDSNEHNLFMQHVIGEDNHLLEVDQLLNDFFSRFDTAIELD